MFHKYIPDGYWNSKSNGIFESHEAICVLNTSTKVVDISLILYFENQEKLEGFSLKVEAERTYHIRLDKIVNKCGIHVPQDIPYAIEVISSQEVYLQYTRVDTSQSELAIATTVI